MGAKILWSPPENVVY